MHNNPETQRAYRITRHRKRLLIIGNKCSMCDETDIDKLLVVCDVDNKLNINNISEEKFNLIKKDCYILCRFHKNEKCNSAQGKRKVIDKDGNVLVHGTLSSYRWCRCTVCVKAHNEYNRKFCYNKSTIAVELI
jgi:hypothetical protein